MPDEVAVLCSEAGSQPTVGISTSCMTHVPVRGRASDGVLQLFRKPATPSCPGLVIHLALELTIPSLGFFLLPPLHPYGHGSGFLSTSLIIAIIPPFRRAIEIVTVPPPTSLVADNAAPAAAPSIPLDA